jgi:aspartate carbamoyltransferase regulatory subunit
MRYVHTLLFSCPDCNLPVAITRVTNERNLEQVDAQKLEIHCSYCERGFGALSADARKHYVEEWN